MTLAPTGQFIVAWQSVGQDGDQGGIYVRRFQHANVVNDRSAFASSSSGGSTTGLLYLLGDRVSQPSGSTTPTTGAVDQLMADLALDSSTSSLVGFDESRRDVSGSPQTLDAALQLDFGLGA